LPPDEIQKRTGCPKASVQRYLAEVEAGKQQRDFTPYFGKDLAPKDLCRLYGTWLANFETPAVPA
jgi:hypothetical protein